MTTRVEAIINNANGHILRLLRAKDDGNRWEYPGGGMEINETILQAVIREVKEETGLNITNVKLLKLQVTNIKRYIFTATADTDNITLSKEHQDYKWLKGGE